VQNTDFGELCVDVTLEKLVMRGPKGQSGVEIANLSGKRTEMITGPGMIMLVCLCSFFFGAAFGWSVLLF